MAFGLKEARQTVSDAASRLATTAADTRAAITGIGVLAGIALVIGLIALVIAVKGRVPHAA